MVQTEHPELFLQWLITVKFCTVLECVFLFFAAVNSPDACLGWKSPFCYFIIVSFKIIAKNEMEERQKMLSAAVNGDLHLTSH